MRVLPTLVVVETLALLTLGLAWWIRGDAMPPGMAPGAGAQTVTSPAAAPRTAGADQPESERTTADARPARREAADPAAAPAPTDVIVRGRLSSTTDVPLPADVSVWFQRTGAFRGATTVDGSYAVAALAPGTWTLRAVADRFAVYESEHELGPEPVQTIDVALSPAHLVKVFVRTPDDQPLTATLDALRMMSGLHVIVTAAPLTGDLPPTDNTDVGNVGLGRYQPTRGPGVSPGPADPDGELWLDRPPPANAVLLLRHIVLAQLPIAAGQDQLRFVVDADDLRGRFGRVSLRLIDGTTGQPLTDGVSVRLSTAQGGGSFGRPDADGRVLIEDVLPGLTSLQIGSTEAREGVWDLVRVPAGATLELGDLVLQPPVQVTGRLIDESGAPVPGGSVRWTNLETMDFPRELVDRRTSSANGDGEFRLSGAGPHRYVLIARDRDARIGYAVVDAGAGAPVEIHLGPGAIVAVTVRRGGFEGFVATVRDADGVPVAARAIGPRSPTAALQVPPGRYTLEVHDVADRLLKRETIALSAGQTLRVEVE